MADDPKLSMRSVGESKLPPSAAGGEDPLTELVRIMSAQLIVDATPATGAKDVPVVRPVGSSNPFANDVQTKLLNDLQALSSAFYSPKPPLTAPEASPPAKPATPPPKPAAAAPPAKPRPTPSAAPTPVTPALAAAPVAHGDKPVPWREGPATADPSRSQKRGWAVSLLRDERHAPGASTVDRPPGRRSTGIASGKLGKERRELAEGRWQATPSAHPSPTEPAAAKPSGHPENVAVKSGADAPAPRLFVATPKAVALLKAAEPQKDELPKPALSGGLAPEEDGAAPPDDRAALTLKAEDGELPALPDEIEDFSHRRPRASLVIGGALLAVVLAAGVAYVTMQSEKSVALPSIVAADPPKIVPAATPAHDDQQKRLIPDRVDGAQAADPEVPASSGDYNNRASRVIEPAGPGFDLSAKAGDAPALGDPPALAAGGDDGSQISAKKALVVVPDPPLLGSKAASDAGKLSPGASAAVPPSAAPTAQGGAAHGSSDAASEETLMDAVVSGKGLPIPINVDPLAISSGGEKAAGDASAVPAASARVPIPPTKPAVSIKRAGKLLPTPPAIASSGDLY